MNNLQETANSFAEEIERLCDIISENCGMVTGLLPLSKEQQVNCAHNVAEAVENIIILCAQHKGRLVEMSQPSPEATEMLVRLATKAIPEMRARSPFRICEPLLTLASLDLGKMLIGGLGTNDLKFNFPHMTPEAEFKIIGVTIRDASRIKHSIPRYEVVRAALDIATRRADQSGGPRSVTWGACSSRLEIMEGRESKRREQAIYCELRIRRLKGPR